MRVNIVFIPFVFALCFVGLLGACKQVPQEQPTLSPDQMAAIIADTYIADAAVSQAYGGIRDSMQAYYYEQVFKRHNVTREEYLKNMALYSRSLVDMDTLMQKGLRILDQQRHE